MNSNAKPLLFGSDCSGGIDAAALAMAQVCRAHGTELRHLFASEIDPHARSVLRANHSIDVIYEDLRTRGEHPPAVDIYCAGFPCQPFSTVGSRRGLDDARGTIFFSCMQYVRARSPPVVVFENVVGLLSMDRGNTFQSIVSCLESAGYRVSHNVLDAADFGLPHSRRRLFIVGALGKGSAIGIQNTRPVAPCPLQSLMQRGLPAKPPSTDRQAAVLAHFMGLVDHDLADRIVNLDASKGFVSPGRPGICPCLTTKCGAYYHTGLQRFITDREACRFMGVPDDYDMNMVSVNKRFRIIGNAIAVPVLREVLDRAYRRVEDERALRRRGDRIVRRKHAALRTYQRVRRR